MVDLGSVEIVRLKMTEMRKIILGNFVSLIFWVLMATESFSFLSSLCSKGQYGADLY